ncbi:DUF2971 domain-containing protein [Pedobacter chitinilyticus]|uniref:DUF2971 domain-containing protein n=1 Tax=Pedobacter chitinilyticus TaxID=2233776 RepID=A0A3S3PIU4_9SPHI|nr:DUF2971 domain-containing protein [Pedobacter chitinilyticus]RWU10638.1 DUF2971 domain-containing protein [Pedobacter chitinilyticus]
MEEKSNLNHVPIEELNLPKTIYKFRDYENPYHLRSLLDSEIYIPSVNEFNDPLDSKTPFRYREEDLTEEKIYKKCLSIAKINYPNRSEQEYQQIAYDIQQKSLIIDEEHIEKFDRMNYNQICNDFGVYCLTPEYDNFLMWSYYSNSHKGFCIGYDSSVIIDCGIFGMGGAVRYKNEFPKLPLFPSEDHQLFLDIFFIKWEIWQHEKEFRLLHQYKNGKIQKLPSNAVSEIILGCNFPEKEKHFFLQLIINKIPNAKVFQMELIPCEFGITKKLVYDESLNIIKANQILE